MPEPIGTSQQTLPTATGESGREQGDRGSRSTLAERGKRGRRELPAAAGTVQGRSLYRAPPFANPSRFTTIAIMSRGDGSDARLTLSYDLQLHNADQLADWCMNHLCVNYNKLCKMSPRSVRLLHPENQEYLNEHRWPPVWYVFSFYFTWNLN